jgi:hypothetical protein
MDGRCPFCWNTNVSAVSRNHEGRRRSFGGELMECRDCEKWFWAETGEEVPRLFEICVTCLINPKSCLEEVRDLLNSGGNAFPRYRTGEFNRLCSDCLSGAFQARRWAARL